MNLSSLLDKVRLALTGEPARFIGYGSALVVVGVVAVANALGISRFGANLDLGSALVGTTAAIGTVTTLVESIRHFVYSPNTVTDLLTEASTDVPAETEPATDAAGPTL